jgi:hypothetical protein
VALPAPAQEITAAQTPVTKPIFTPVTGNAIPHPTMNGAVALFNQRKFGESLKQLEYLDKHGQCNEKTHYYIARCAQQLSQIARAQRNYAWILHYGKDKTLRYYAAYGYRQVARYSANRTYEGNGNNFQGFQGGGASRGCGGGGGGG